MMLERLQELAGAGLMRQLDYQLAAVLGELGEDREGVLLAAALASRQAQQVARDPQFPRPAQRGLLQ